MSARVVSVNVGRSEPLWTGSRIVDSAIVKPPVSGPVAARGVNLEGDEQADRVNHGGPDQAVYAYASKIVHRPEHHVTVSLAIQGLLIDRARLGELEPARSDMLPKLASWYEERLAA